MSVNALKPKFHDHAGYLAWRKTWKAVYAELSKRLVAARQTLKSHNRALSAGSITDADRAAMIRLQKNLPLMRADATKMMTLLKEAKLLRRRITEMHHQINNQGFPLDLGECRVIDFHFNKVAISYPFMPRWVIKAKGTTYYVRHIEANVPWTTRELEEGSTLGMIRFRKATLSINEDGVAKLAE